jgi:hypothetical protein
VPGAAVGAFVAVGDADVVGALVVLGDAVTVAAVVGEPDHEGPGSGVPDVLATGRLAVGAPAGRPRRASAVMVPPARRETAATEATNRPRTVTLRGPRAPGVGGDCRTQ